MTHLTVKENGKELVVKLQTGFELTGRTIELYQDIMKILKDADVQNVNEYLYSLFPDWPMKELKEGKRVKLGLNNTLKEYPKYMPAKYVNAFSVWRSRQNKKEKPPVKKEKGQDVKGRKEEEQVAGRLLAVVPLRKGMGYDAVAASIREVDVPKYLALIAELAKKKGNDKAVKLCVELNKAFQEKVIAKPVNKKGKGN